MRWRLALAAVIIATAALAGVILVRSRPRPTLKLNTSVLSQLPQHATSVVPIRLKSGLVPPTNRWFSSLVFAKTPQPIFAYPLSFRPTRSGFELDAPQITGSSNAVFASHRPTLVVDLGADAGEVSAYDDLSVTLAQSSAGRPVASIKIIQGSPLVYVAMPAGGQVKLSSSGQVSSLHSDGKLIRIGDQTFGVVASGEITSDAGNIVLTLPRGGEMTLFALPEGADAQIYYNASSHPVTATSADYRSAGGRLITTYHLSARGGSTLFAASPNIPLVQSIQVKGTFPTLLGEQAVALGNTFVSSQPLQDPPTSLDLTKLSSADREDLIAQVKADSQILKFEATDTYFSGKELYRAANLLQLAHQLGQVEVARRIQTQLKTELLTWFDPAGQVKRPEKYFYYDSTYKGVVGVKTGFGSEIFNDHHFHYGYFIYASAVLAQYDQKFYATVSPMVELLISDIASPDTTKQFPRLRVFDVYAGHSWASGNGDFADGNNQESSSEAVNAWYAIYLWGLASHNPALQQHGQWLYQLESNAATTTWLRQSGDTRLAKGYAHPFVALVWGGKLDYGTFFSARPQDILGIQLIPMSPGQAYLSLGSKDNINRNIFSVAPSPSDLDGPFGDYVVMYQSLSDPAEAHDNLTKLSSASIDSANSRSYLKAWVYSHSNHN